MIMFLLLVGVVLLLLGGITGIVLFIIGLVKHKPSMWGSGIVLGVLTLLLLAGGVVGLGYYLLMPMPSQQYGTLINDSALESTSQADPNWEADRPARDLQNANRYFKDHVGAALPDGVSVIWRGTFRSVSVNGGPDSYDYQYQLSVPADFDKFLETHFTKAQWPDVKEQFLEWKSFKGTHDPALPEETQLASMSFHTFAKADPSDASTKFTTHIALDPNTRCAWVIGKEQHRE